jgi:hypothetical protein
MTDETKENELKETKKNNNIVCIGLDIGTGNMVCSRNDNPEPKSTRNMFLKLDREDVEINEMTDIAHIESDENEIFIIGDDAFRFCNIFGKEVNRPMKDGLISAKEIDAIDVLALMIKDLIGDIENKDAYCSYSIPAEPIDQDRSVIYHEKVFGRVFDSLGISHTPVNEGMAIIYSECEKEKYSGCALSFGSGMCNCTLSYKGVPVLQFSTTRSGDYIDRCVAESLDIVPNRVTSVKERKFDLNYSFMDEKNKKTKRILESLHYYYNSMIEYTIKKIIKKFEEDVDIDVDEELPIIVSGGTSMPDGFLNIFKDVIGKFDLPFEVGEIRQASNPLTSVSNGLMLKTMKDLNIKK